MTNPRSLPEARTLNGFDFAAHPDVDEELIRDLAGLGFLGHAANLLLVGPPGAGKTRLAAALARSAVEAGHRVHFTTAADLVAVCHKAALEDRWNICIQRFADPELLVIDGLGPLSGHGASALFQIINQRYLKSSTMVTTNIEIADWASTFADSTVAVTMLDRLLHRATIIGMGGPGHGS